MTRDEKIATMRAAARIVAAFRKRPRLRHEMRVDMMTAEDICRLIADELLVYPNLALEVDDG